MIEASSGAQRRSMGWWLACALVCGPAAAAGCGETSTDGVGVAATGLCPGPDVDLWYGDALHPDLWGHPQRQVNVLGNVSDPDGVVSFRYALNGGAFVEAPLGRDGLRLQNTGDFNISIDRALLAEGTNALELLADDGAGDSCSRTLTIEHDSSARWPLPHSARFDTVGGPSEIEQVVQVVDGLWEPTASGLYTAQTGYDRLLAVGDRTWQPGYEARASVTLHRFGSWHGVGIGIGWQGHTGTEDPPVEWPIGALTWVRNKSDGPTLEILTYDQGLRAAVPMTLLEGRTYVFKVRGEPEGAGDMRVQVKVWDEATVEPAEWHASATVDARAGSVLLVSHAAETTWHDIAVRSTSLGLDAGTPADAGSPGIDAGSSPMDAGTPPMDAGTPPMDAGPSPVDAGSAVRSSRGLIALWELEEGAGDVVHDTSGWPLRVDLVVEDPANVSWIRGGLSVNAPTRIVATGGSAALVDAVVATDEVSIEAWLRTADLEQDGPARIVTLSEASRSRNLTLGQGLWGSAAADRLDVRLRTTATNDNGQPSLSTPGGSLGGALTHVVYTRDATGTARIYVDGIELASGDRGGDLSEWDPGHTLALANEVRGNRPWLGELHLVALFDRALSAQDVARHFAAGPDGSTGAPVDAGTDAGTGMDAGTRMDAGTGTDAGTGMDAGTRMDAGTDAGEPPVAGSRVSAGLLALYTLDEGMGSVVADTAGVGTPLDLIIEDPMRVSWRPGALSIDGDTRIVSSGVAGEIADAVVASDEITVEAWLTTADLTQDGPARIVSISESAHARNVTLGQGLWGSAAADRIDVRLRTTTTSDNGQPSLTTGSGTLTAALTHVVYTRDALGVARIYIDGVEQASELVEGDLSSWSPSQPLVLANELDGSRPWRGVLHLVALFDRALSREEVAQNFTAGPEAE